MAQVFNPWKDPPSTDTLPGDLASFEINEMPDPESAQEDSAEMTGDTGHAAMMQQALSVISQQAALIDKLMKTLGK